MAKYKLSFKNVLKQNTTFNIYLKEKHLMIIISFVLRKKTFGVN